MVNVLAKDSMRRSGRYARLAELLSNVSDALARRELPDGAVIDDVVEAAREVGLQPRPVSAVTRKHDVHRPLLHETPAVVLADGAARLVATDQVPGRAVRLLFETGDGARRACLFPRRESPDEELGFFHCLNLPPAEGAGASDDGWRSAWIWAGNEMLLVTGKGSRSLVERVEPVRSEVLGTVDGEVVAGLSDARGERLVVESDRRWWSFEVGRDQLGKKKPLVALNENTRFVHAASGQVLWAEQAFGQTDSVYSAPLAALEAREEGRELRGRVPETSFAVSCRAGASTVVLVQGRNSRPAVTRERHAVVLFHDGKGWSPPVSTDAKWTTDVVAGVASPRKPTFTCSANEAVLTWTDPENQSRVSQTRCSRQGCAHATTFLAHEQAEEVLVADFAGKVIFVWNDLANRVLRLRAAPLARLAQARDVVLHDDAEAGRASGSAPSAPLHILVRENALLVLLRAARGDSGQIIAVRYDSDHEPAFPEELTTP